MADAKPVKRLTESVPGRLAGWLLALLWIYSLSGVDARAFSAFPVCVVLGSVAVLVLLGLLMGCRVVRMSWLGWFSLAAGGYFFCRCLNSYAMVESWGESALIAGAFVYYIAGVYVAQNRRYTSVVLVLALALVLSMAAWWMVKQPWFCLEWTGRAEYTPDGKNSFPRALLVYKNFAGFFFVAGGVALGGWALWTQHGMTKALLFALAVTVVVVSFFCATRAPLFLAPIALLGLWVFDMLLRMFAGKKIGGVSYFVGAVVLVLVLVGTYDFFFGRALSSFFDDTDSHGRYGIWAAVCEVLPRTPLWGHGAASVQWETIPFYRETHLINAAHNEYLQVWLDYGMIGLLLMLAIIVGHVVQGLKCAASEQIEVSRRALVFVAVLLLVFVAAYATADFPWHSFALTAMCAFVCGILASPFPYVRDAHKWGDVSNAPVERVRAQRRGGVILLVAVACAVVCWGVWLGEKLYPVWYSQWEYNQLSRGDGDRYGHERRGMIERLLPGYPASSMMDTYYMLPSYNSDWKKRERLLNVVLDANPKQMYMVALLAEAMGKQKRHEEVEKMLRRIYHEAGLNDVGVNIWPVVYAYNLLMWAREDMARQQYGLALSKLQYVMDINKWRRVNFGSVQIQSKERGREHIQIKPWLKDVLLGSERDIRLIRLLGEEPDDSWKQPLEPGGNPALYTATVDKLQKK